MRAMRVIGLTSIAIAWLVVLVSPKRRRAITRKLAEARRFAWRRILDEEARATTRAADAWEDEGGALREGRDTDDANAVNGVAANGVIESPPR